MQPKNYTKYENTRTHKHKNFDWKWPNSAIEHKVLNGPKSLLQNEIFEKLKET
jgi:hypothetical protein